MKPLLIAEIPQLKLCNRGKVRDIYEIGDNLLIIASDRISAFDVVLSDGIPYKGMVLTGLSEFWFKYTSDIVENHLITTQIDRMNNSAISQFSAILQGRSMLVKKVKVFPVECVIRGYLAGSGWKEYQKTQAICGIKLPAGLKESDKLPRTHLYPVNKGRHRTRRKHPLFKGGRSDRKEVCRRVTGKEHEGIPQGRQLREGEGYYHLRYQI